MKEQIRMYEALSQRHLRSATYLMLTWEPHDVSAATLAATLRHATGRDVQILDQLPSPIDGPYLEQATRLQPERDGDPWLAVLLAYDMRGTIDATVLHALMQVNCDLSIAIDVQTLSRNRAMQKAESAFSVARTVQRDQQIIDVRAQRVQADAERVLHALAAESLHVVDIAVLVSGATADELDSNVAEVQGLLGAQLRLMRPAGVQGELLKFWSATPSVQIEAPLIRRNVLSHGVGCLLGVLGYHRASTTDGLFWGLDAVRRAPLFFDLFKNNQAAHMVILGKSGYGKTFFLNVLALRGAALANYRVIGIDAFRNGTRVEAAAQAGACCHYLGLDTPINILDIVYGDDTEGDWRANQDQFAIGQLGLFMGTPGKSANGKDRYIPREFSIPERGVLDRALSALYLPLDPDTPLDQMPILSDLIARLEQYQEIEARQLARELRMLITGSEEPGAPLNVLGRSFNRRTRIDWNFTRDINYYDFTDVPEQLRPLYYAQAIGAILREMRNPHRNRRRKILLQIDEFGYLSQIESLAHLAATLCKVARKYGLGLIAIDQNPITFLDSQHGRFIFENAVAKVLFHLDDLPARQIGDAISDLTPAHIEFLSHAQVGECLAVVGNDVYVMTVESNPREVRALRGS
jgi:hypothetical protein